MTATTPRASTPAVRARMRAQRNAGTRPELAVLAACRALGLRPRPWPALRVDAGRPIRPDLAWDRARVAVFVHGCWWHACPTHHRPARSNAAWWAAKVAANRARDARQARRLRAAGWTVVTVWEHDDPARAGRRIAAAVAAR